MEQIERLEELRAGGRIGWSYGERGWVAEPDEIVSVLAAEGFEECKREEARSGRDRAPAGGLWQGLDRRTGSVASAVWVQRESTPPLVFIEIDGEPVRGQ